jgi:hypothetical protein
MSVRCVAKVVSTDATAKWRLFIIILYFYLRDFHGVIFITFYRLESLMTTRKKLSQNRYALTGVRNKHLTNSALSVEFVYSVAHQLLLQ